MKANPKSSAASCETEKSIEEIFRRAQAAFNGWSKLPPEERTAAAILNALDFDFFELLDSVTIARSRKHIQTFYNTEEVGTFPERLKPISFHCPLTHRTDVIGLNEIFDRLTMLKLSVYAPVSYILPSRSRKYEALYDTEIEGGMARLKQADRERSLQALMTVNLLKRLESSVEAFRITLNKLARESLATRLRSIEAFKRTGKDTGFMDMTAAYEDVEPDEDELPDPDEQQIGGKVRISLADMDLPSWEHDLKADLAVIELALGGDEKDHARSEMPSSSISKSRSRRSSAARSIRATRKLLIFTAFADTANYLYANIAPDVLAKHGLHSGKVTGTESPKTTLNKGYDFQSVLTLFSPISKEKEAIFPNEPGEIDILIGTDCISEGQNLQDCDYGHQLRHSLESGAHHPALRADRPHRVEEFRHPAGQLLA